MMPPAPAGRGNARIVLLLVASASVITSGAVAQSAAYPNGAVVQTLPVANDPADRLARALRTLSYNPNDLAALSAAGSNALALGDPNAAVGFFGRASQISPRDGRLKAGLGSALTQLGQPAQALRLFGEASSLRVPDADLAGDRGLAYDLTGDPARAQRDYLLVLAAHPDDDAARRRLALSQGIAGDRKGAIATLDPLIRKRDIAAWRAQTFVLAMTGDTAGANDITRIMLPTQQAALQPFLVRLASLTPAQKARAVHFGEMPAGRSPAVPAQTAPTQTARTVAAVPAPSPVSPPAVAYAAPVASRPSDLAVASPRPSTPVARPPIAVASVAPAPVAVAAPSPVSTASSSPASVAAPAPARTRRRPTEDEAYCNSVRSSLLWMYYASACRAPLASLALAEPPRRAVATSQEPASGATTPAAGNAATPAPVAPAPSSPAPSVPAAVALPSPSPATPSSAATIASASPMVATTAPTPLSSPTAATVATSAAPTLPGLPIAATTGAGHYDMPHEVTPRARPVAPKPAPVRVVQARPVAPQPEPARAETAPKTEAASRGRTIAAKITTGSKATPVVEEPADAEPSERATKSRSGARAADAKDAKTKGKSRTEPDTGKRGRSDDKSRADETGRSGRSKASDSDDRRDDDKRHGDARDTRRDDDKRPDDKAGKGRKTATADASRVYVQVASGANRADMDKAWDGVKKKAPDVMKGKAPSTTPLRATNRLLVGPFRDEDEAQGFVNKMAGKGLSGFVFKSAKGQKVDKVGAEK